MVPKQENYTVNVTKYQYENVQQAYTAYKQEMVSKPMTRELIFASPIDRPASTASLAITALLRDEVAACRKEGLWDIRLA